MFYKMFHSTRQMFLFVLPLVMGSGVKLNSNFKLENQYSYFFLSFKAVYIVFPVFSSLCEEKRMTTMQKLKLS